MLWFIHTVDCKSSPCFFYWFYSPFENVIVAMCPAEQAAAAEVSLPAPADFMQAFAAGELQRLLVLEGLQDPGNMVRPQLHSTLF